MVNSKDNAMELLEQMYGHLEKAVQMAEDSLGLNRKRSPAQTDLLSALNKDIRMWRTNYRLAQIFWREKSGLKTNIPSDLEKELEKEEFSHPNVGDIKIGRYDSSHSIIANKMMYFLLPTSNSEKRIDTALEEVKKQVCMLPEDYDHKIFVAVNNTTDNTLLKISEFIDDNLWNLNITVFYIYDELPGFGKLQALNYMVSKAREDIMNRRNKPDLEAYLNVIDDDILFNNSSLMENVRELEKNKNLKAISGTYSTTREISGFHEIISVRKKVSLLYDLIFPRVYGGCLTMRIDDFPKGLIPIEVGSEDIYLTFLFLEDMLNNTKKDISEILPEDLTVRTNPNLFVEHSETYTFPYFIYRFIRDMEWLDKNMSSFSDRTKEAFLELDKLYFNNITERVRKSSPEISLAHAVNGNLKDIFLQLYKEGMIHSDDMSQMWIPTFEYDSAFEFCEKIISKERFMPIVEKLNKFGFISPDEIEFLYDDSQTLKHRFKDVENTISTNLKKIKRIRMKEQAGDDITRLTDYIDTNLRLRAILRDEKEMSKILVRAGLPYEGRLRVEALEDHGRANFHFYVSSGKNKYFVRYNDPFGKEFFPKLNPSSSVYSYMLAESTFRFLMGDEYILTTLYPNLYTAKRNHTGYVERNDLEKVLQRIIIQKDMRDECVLLGEYSKGDEKEAIRCYAGLLARMHASSLGFFGDIFSKKKESPSRKKARTLLQENYRLMRNKDVKEYEIWLLRKSWITRQLEYRLKNQNSKVVYALLGNSLQEAHNYHKRWRDTMEESVQMIHYLGSLGHLDYKPSNIFVNNKRGIPPTGILFDFDYCGFVEPSCECGSALYTMLKSLYFKDRAIFNVDDGLNNAQLYFTEYLKTFKEIGGEEFDMICSSMRKKADEILDIVKKIASRFAGYIILGALDESRYLSGKNEEDFIQPLARMCENLIKS